MQRLILALTILTACGDNFDGNRPPVIDDLNLTTDEDQPLTRTIDVTDPDAAGSITITAGEPAHGTVTTTSDSFVYTPAANFHGTDMFTVTASDGTLSDSAVVTVTVLPINDAPSGVADSFATDEDSMHTATITTLLANDSDVDADTLTITSVGNAMNGSVVRAGNDVTFMPTTNFVGTGNYHYTLSDGTASVDVLVTVSIGGVNDVPVAVDDVDATAEDTDLVVTEASLVSNDTDSDGQTLMVSAVSNATHGTVLLASGSVTFTPEANFSGTATFDYTVTDGMASDTGTVTVTVNAVNDDPVAGNDTASTSEEVPVTVTAAMMLANDSDVETTPTITAASNPMNGTITFSNGDVTFTPAADFFGTGSYQYTLSDGDGGTATGTVTVTVTNVNDAPVANADAAQAQSDVATQYDTSTFLANDTDLDGPMALTITAVGNAQPGHTVSLAGTTITYQSPAAFIGTTTFEYTLFDGVDTSTGTVTVNVVACGDGVITGAENCDDGNTTPADGCSAVCQTELGYTCTGQPSACTTTCGDSIPAGAEECDDGDLDELDGCTTDCVASVVCDATAFAGADRFAVNPATGTCYASYDGELTTFADAQSACVAAGGHLATITSSVENDIVKSVQNTAENPWIGANEDANDTDNVFAWVTGEPFGFTSFASNQPDDDAGVDGNGDCLHLLNAAGEWNDTNCNIATFVTGRICELAVDTCGDNIVQSSQGEDCDDGNATNGDGCSASCAFENLVTFSFTGAAGNEASFAADSTAPGLSATPTMVRGPGVTNTNTAANAFTAESWSLAATPGLDVNDYYSFTVTPAAPAIMNLFALELDERRSGTGIRNWSIRSSIDGFAADLASFAVPDDTATRVDQQVLLGPAFRNLTTAVEFRIYGFDAEAAGGTWRVDNVQLAGGAQ